jgi:Zn-dependent peptidase ImmA (M78 family)/predicted secreted protein
VITWRRAHLVGALEAGRARRRLGFTSDEPADPIDALTRFGVVVLRRPLSGLAGAYLPSVELSAPGVVLNANHPVAKQTYTAAHELAHHLLHSEIALDVETEWIARDRRIGSSAERIAEAFAAWFLMPLGLVRNILDSIGATGPRFEPDDVYQTALRLGTSFAATAWHLAALRLTPLVEARRLVAIAPASIKQGLLHGLIQQVGRRDVWSVYVNEGTMRPYVDDLVTTELVEHLSAGYSWRVSPPASLKLVAEQSSDTAAPDVFGSPALYRAVFEVASPGRGELVLTEGRVWDPHDSATRVTIVDPVPMPHIGLATLGTVLPDVVTS